MDTLSRQELVDLASREQFPSVSILMPVTGSAQDAIRLRNLLRDAEHRMLAAGVSLAASTGLLAPAVRLAERAARGTGYDQPRGLALYLGGGGAQCFALAYPVPAEAVVAERFHVSPLLASLDGDGRFFVLALSQHGVRLYQGTRERLRRLPLPGVPATLDQALPNHHEEQLRLHETGPARPGSRPAAIFHGHGDSGDDAKERITRYFREVDRVVCRTLRGERAPLLLAGVDYLLALYERVASYAPLARGRVHGNPRQLGRHALHELAWAAVREELAAGDDVATERYQQLRGTGRTVDGLAQVAEAAGEGRVAALLLPPADQLPAGEGAVRLLDLAVARALACGGEVHALRAGQLPAGDLPAAVLRY